MTVADDGWGPSGGLGPRAAVADPELPPAPRAQPIPEAERRRWEHADLLAATTQVGGRGPSEHRPAGQDRTVVVNQAASTYAELVSGTRLPRGALVAQRHHDNDSDAVRSWYVMLRPSEGPDDGWQFIVLDAELRVAAHRDLQLCARCHLEAPHDALFGPPPDLAQATAP